MIDAISGGGRAPSVGAPRPVSSSTSDDGGAAPRRGRLDRVSLSAGGRKLAGTGPGAPTTAELAARAAERGLHDQKGTAAVLEVKAAEGRQRSGHAGTASLVSSTVDRAVNGGDGSGTRALLGRAQSLTQSTALSKHDAARNERLLARSVYGEAGPEPVQGPGRGGGQGGSDKIVQQLMERVRSATRAAYDIGGSPAVAAVPAGVLIQTRA